MVVKNIVETIKERLDSGGKIKDLYWDKSYGDFERKLVARAGEKYRPHWYYPFKVEAEEDMYKEGYFNSKIVPISKECTFFTKQSFRAKDFPVDIT